MPERASKVLFVIELAVLAVPGILMLSVYSVFFGSVFFGLGTPLVVPFEATIGFFAMILAVFLVAASGAIALWKFAVMAVLFINGGAAALRGARKTFNRGLLFALAPLGLMLFIGLNVMWDIGFAAARSERAVIDLIATVYFSGLALLVPVLHLWLEMRYRRVSS